MNKQSMAFLLASIWGIVAAPASADMDNNVVSMANNVALPPGTMKCYVTAKDHQECFRKGGMIGMDPTGGASGAGSSSSSAMGTGAGTSSTMGSGAGSTSSTTGSTASAQDFFGSNDSSNTSNTSNNKSNATRSATSSSNANDASGLSSGMRCYLVVKDQQECSMKGGTIEQPR